MAAVAEQTVGLRRAAPATGQQTQMMSLKEDSGLPVIWGYMLVWDEWAEIKSLFEGHFLEQFARGCADKTLRDSKKMQCLYQHGEDPMVGAKPLGPIISTR